MTAAEPPPPAPAGIEQFVHQYYDSVRFEYRQTLALIADVREAAHIHGMDHDDESLARFNDCVTALEFRALSYDINMGKFLDTVCMGGIYAAPVTAPTAYAAGGRREPVQPVLVTEMIPHGTVPGQIKATSKRVGRFI